MGDDFLIRAAIEWAKIAARVRDVSAGGEPLRQAVLRLPREAAWCHLLLVADRPAAVVTCLRRVLRDAGCPADLSGTGDVFVDATAILANLRRAVHCRFAT